MVYQATYKEPFAWADSWLQLEEAVHQVINEKLCAVAAEGKWDVGRQLSAAGPA